MDADLTHLEAQLEQLISLYTGLKAENRDLRARVVKLESDNRALADKVSYATSKIEAVLEQLPEA
ncbi:hypothetical protein [Azoarcus olearius]|uniref:Cell division protein ZapB n=1 Tax=Azoarcus sp. (strain BH72) TaxID=418699 RepID=A1K345_AZOSB|nr:hypothetical protein [Azoarcus olearius]ANQ83777.1 hypothetical protein dqs_0702 [Azoarcus olearius]CAL93250.1 conserved hypothetical protein [Azoarcus olearius]